MSGADSVLSAPFTFIFIGSKSCGFVRRGKQNPNRALDTGAQNLELFF
jgi:hypothetical protein